MGPLDTIGAGGVCFKAKYIKRTGTSGKYRYWYRNPKTGKVEAGKQPAKKPSGYSKEGIPSEATSKKLLTKFEDTVEDYRDMLSETADLERGDAYKEFDKTEKVAYERMNNEISRARNQRDRKLNMVSDKYLQLSKKVSSVNEGGKKIHSNVGDLGGAMEELEEVGSDISLWKQSRDFLAGGRPKD